MKDGLLEEESTCQKRGTIPEPENYPVLSQSLGHVSHTTTGLHTTFSLASELCVSHRPDSLLSLSLSFPHLNTHTGGAHKLAD